MVFKLSKKLFKAGIWNQVLAMCHSHPIKGKNRKQKNMDLNLHFNTTSDGQILEFVPNRFLDKKESGVVYAPDSLQVLILKFRFKTAVIIQF